MDRLLLFFGLLRPTPRRIKYWMQVQNISCLRRVLKRGRAKERRSVVRALHSHPNLTNSLLPALLNQLRYHSLELACDTADFLQATYSSYAAPPEVIEGLLNFSERQTREESRLNSLTWYKSTLYRNGLIDKGKMKQLERVRQQLKKPISRFGLS